MASSNLEENNKVKEIEMSNDKNTDNDEVTKHTGLSWAGLEDNVDGLRLKIEEVFKWSSVLEASWKQTKNIPNLSSKETYFYILITFSPD